MESYEITVHVETDRTYRIRAASRDAALDEASRRAREEISGITMATFTDVRRLSADEDYNTTNL